MSERRLSVGLVGAGTMGSRMARALQAAGYEPVICDISHDVQQTEREHGCTVVGTPRLVAEQCKIVLLSLPLPQDVQDVVAGGNEAILSADPRPDYVVDLSTVDPGTTRKLAATSASYGVRYLDAPVLGRPGRCGHWTLPIGGSVEDIDAVTPVLSAIADSIRRVGPVGSGHALKLLNNLMFGAINAITVECMAAAPKLGLDQEMFFETIVASGAATVSNLLREIGPKILSHDWSPTFSLALLEKDNRLGVEMSEAVGAQMHVARAVTRLNENGVLHDLGPLDTCSLIELLLEQQVPDETAIA